jgi:response regulator RpfG family c-di-GMP phosphodiesterase
MVMEKVLLIVDDSKDLVEIVENVLEGVFDRIVTAATVDEAQQKVSENVFDTIILDINLDGRNGGEVIKFIMDHPENKNNRCPVILISGIITEDFIARNEARYAGILMKPFAHEHLFGIVKNILEEPIDSDIANEEKEDFPEPVFDLPFPIPELKTKVKNVLAGVKKNSKLKQLFAEMEVDRLSDNYLMAHVGICINISTYICMKLDWSTDKTLEKFVYASYLHDMALASRPDLARIHGSLFEVELVREKLSPADFKLILEHPNLAANKIDEIGGDMPPDVSAIVRQHHELPKENGFPAMVGHNKITPLATVFIVAHDLTDFILDNPNWVMSNFMTRAKAKYKGQHFAKVLSALNEMT